MIPVPLLFVLALLSATGPFATDMYLPVLPSIVAEFGVEPSVVQLTLTGFFLGMGAGQLVIGPLSDVLGRKRLLIFGATVALAASIVAAIAPSIGVLIAARLFQGLGGGASAVLARAIVPDLASGKQAARAFSILMAIGALAPAIAPILGGLLAEPIGWRGIYWVLSGLHAIQLILAIWIVPSTGGNSPQNGNIIVRMGRNYLAVMSVKRFWGFTISMMFGFASIFCYISASPFVIQGVHGFSPRAYSFVFATNSLGLVAMSLINSKTVQKYGPSVMLRVGVISQVTASATLFLVTSVNAPVWLQLTALFFCVGPTGLIMGNSTAMATGMLRPYAGSVSALMGFCQSLAAGVVSPLMGLGSYPPMTMAIGMVTCSVIGGLGAWYATSKFDLQTLES